MTIPVGGVPPTHASVATRCQHLWGSQVNKFQQVSSLDHQMSLEGFLYREVPCSGGQGWGGGTLPVQCSSMSGVGGPCMVRSNVSWIMVTWDPLPP